MASVRSKVNHSLQSRNIEAENIGHGNVLQARKTILEPQTVRPKRALGDLKNVFHLKNCETPKGQLHKQDLLRSKSYSVTKVVTKKNDKLKEKNPLPLKKGPTKNYSSGKSGFNLHEKWLQENILSFDELDSIFAKCNAVEQREQNGEIPDYNIHVKKMSKQYKEMNSEIDKILNETAKKREEISPFKLDDLLPFDLKITGNKLGTGLFAPSLPEDEELLKDLEFLGL